MKSLLNCQQFKVLLLAPSLFALALTTGEGASAISSSTASNQIKDTNYPIPGDAYFVAPSTIPDKVGQPCNTASLSASKSTQPEGCPTLSRIIGPPQGKNSNSGSSPDSPWPVELALKSAPSGSTIVFRGGIYRNVTAPINKKLTLQAYPGENPWLKGSIEVKDWVPSGSIWRFDGWNYSFPPSLSVQYYDPHYPMAGYRDMVYISGKPLKQVGSLAEVEPGTFYVDAASKQLYIGDNPTGKTVEATAHKQAFGLWQGSDSTIIRGLGFAHYADKALGVTAAKVTLENNTFVWNGMQGVALSGTDAIVVGNTFSYNGRKGIGGSRAHRMLLAGNKIAHNNIEHFRTKWDAAGVKFIKTHGLVWRNNLVEHNSGMGMWVDVSSTDATIVNNTVRFNHSIGIMFEISARAIIANNVVLKNAMSGIMVSESSGARVYNNTLVMNHKHIVIKDAPRTNTNTKERNAGIAWTTRNNVIKNNIFWNTSGGNPLEASDCSTKQTSQTMIAATDYNAYYRATISQPKSLIGWSDGGSNCDIKYGDLADFKSATGYEANSLSVDSAADPFFVNAARGDFRLKPGSPAIGRGTALPLDIAAAIGLPKGLKVDLGALESKVVFVSEAKPSSHSKRDSDWFAASAWGKLSKWLGIKVVFAAPCSPFAHYN